MDACAARPLHLAICARRVEHKDTYDQDNLLTRGQAVAVEVDESQAVDAALQSGQMSIHHGRVFHASHPNRSNYRRIGLAIRYIPARATQVADGNMAAMLVRGKDDYGHFRSCRRPCGVMMPEDVAHWREIARARNSVMLAKR